MDVEKYYEAQRANHAHDHLTFEALTRSFLSDMELRKKGGSTGHHVIDKAKECLLPLVKQPHTWITFGDGHFACDAAWLIEHKQDVHATDIQDATLKIAAEHGHIKKYSIENAEKLSLANNSYDWGLCKEAYHHMPRPQIGFHEMLRVCKKGLVLIEPIDIEPLRWWGYLSKMLISLVKKTPDRFETSGNFLYTLSRSEIEKMMLGIGLKHYAFKWQTISYIKDCEYEMYPGPMAKKINLRNRLASLRNRLLGVSAGTGVFIVFKDAESIPKDLESYGYVVTELPSNPYI